MSDKIKDNRSFIEKVEQEFDWNLISIVSIWIFLISTYFLIYVG
ncbi:MAG: hypothetical protein GQF41_3138 [Candidatus Rifleibacterium amylolyticum]|nr:MAG: hypothetical protein GQF41_3138 [Candidatus Rifleibacterium amylolyticum]